MITDEQRTGVSRDATITKLEITTMPFLSSRVKFQHLQRMFDLGDQKLPRLPAPHEQML